MHKVTRVCLDHRQSMAAAGYAPLYSGFFLSSAKNASAQRRVSSKSFGKKPSRISIIKQLIHGYPRGIGILKEFVQNADDAKASHIHFILDLRHQSAERLPDERMRPLMGPALLVVNDSEFSKDDLESIQAIAESSKKSTSSKIGRFGLGFNTCYNVTDFPSFVTRNGIFCLDPHQAACADGEDEGAQWTLEEAWALFPDWPAVFQAGGLEQNATRHKGAIFRLPLRDLTQASASQICKEAFLPEHFHQIVDQLREVGPEMLLFTQHLTTFTVSEILSDGSVAPRRLLSFQTRNLREVRAARKRFQEVLDAAEGAVSPSHSEPFRVGETPRVRYEHHFAVERAEVQTEQKWLVVQGGFGSPQSELLAAASELIAAGEKALPVAGVAIQLATEEGASPPQPVEGAVFCGLPVKQTLHLPIHINGYFELDSHRTGLTDDVNVSSKIGQARQRWNELLLRSGVAVAYAEALHAATEYVDRTAPAQIEAFYRLWPRSTATDSRLKQVLVAATYTELARRPVLLTASQKGDRWSSLTECTCLPPKWHDKLLQPLTACGYTVCHPPISEELERAFSAAQIRLPVLQPQALRSKLITNRDINCVLEDAQPACLQRREWLELLLQFCISDDPQSIRGLPLALLCDGKLHTFGLSGTGPIFIATSEQQAIFPTRPQDFIDPKFAKGSRLYAFPQDNLREMSAEDVIKRLLQLQFPKERPLPWDAKGKEFPNEKWLKALIKYINSNEAIDLASYQDVLQDMPLVPDQFGRLHTPGWTHTPLIAAKGELDKVLLHALQTTRVPILSGSEVLLAEFRTLQEQNPDTFIWPLTGPNLVDTLDAVVTESMLPAKFSKTIHEPLLNYLAEERWRQKDCEAGSYSEENRTTLAQIPFLPTDQGDAVAASEQGLFVAAGVRTPEVLLSKEVRLLRTDQGTWSALYEWLGVRKLDLTALLNQALASYPKLPSNDQLSVLIWIRDEIIPQLENLAKRAPGEVTPSREALRRTSLIRCTDGNLRAGGTLYMPDADGVFHVLGDSGPQPDLRIYIDEPKRWLGLFETLGAHRKPLPQHLLDRVDALTSAYGTASVPAREEIRVKLTRVFEHMGERWKELESILVSDGSLRVKLSQALSKRACLPALVASTEKRRPIALRAFDDRLYRPSEVYSSARVNLVASQRPVCALAGLKGGILSAIGVLSEPDVNIVLLHLDQVLQVWTQKSEPSASAERLTTTLHEIYRYLGQRKSQPVTGPYRGPPVDWAAITARYKDQPCIWDRQHKRLWRPRHVFGHVPPFMAGRRCILREDDATVRSGMELLGCSDTLDWDDLCTFLEELQEESAGGPLSKEDANRALAALLRIKELLNEDLAEERDPLLLTATLRLLPASKIFVQDAPWLRSHIDATKVEFVHAGIDRSLLTEFDVPRLSDLVAEQLLAEPSPARLQSAIEACRVMTTRLRTPELQRGLLRILLRHSSELPEDLSWLESLEVQACASIPSQLVLQRDEEPAQIISSGRHDTTHFYDEQHKRILVYEKEHEFIEHFVALVIQQLVGEEFLQDLSPLQRILRELPARIAKTLDILQIPDFGEPAERVEYVFDASEPPDQIWEESEGEVPPDHINQPAAPNLEDEESSGIDGDDVDEDGDALELLPERANAQPGSILDASNGTQDVVQSAPIQSGFAGAGGGRPHLPRSEGRSGTGTSGVSQRRPITGSSTNAGGSLPVLLPLTPGTGATSSLSSFSGASHDRVITYVMPDDASAEGVEDSAAAALAEAALTAVLSLERSEGRQPAVADAATAGYQAISQEADGQSRYLIIKGLPGDWTVAGVALSRAEFLLAQKLGSQVWLYVIERAYDSSFIPHAIQDPAGKISQYRIDHGWKGLAIHSAPTLASRSVPTKGWRVRLTNGEEGVLEEDPKDYGTVRRLKIRLTDGTLVTKMNGPDVALSPPLSAEGEPDGQDVP